MHAARPANVGRAFFETANTKIQTPEKDQSSTPNIFCITAEEAPGKPILGPAL
jgi:hypothetical protein